MDLSFSIDDAEVMALLARLQERAATLQPVMAEIGLFYERSVMENFQAEKSPDGKAWAPLSAATLAMKLGKKNKKGERYGFKKNGYLSTKGKNYLRGKRILWESGDLEAAVHSQAINASARIGVGGHIKYAAIHQFGGQAGRGKKVQIPARPYLAVNQGGKLALAEKDRDMITRLLTEHLETDLQ